MKYDLKSPKFLGVYLEDLGVQTPAQCLIMTSARTFHASSVPSPSTALAKAISSLDSRRPRSQVVETSDFRYFLYPFLMFTLRLHDQFNRILPLPTGPQVVPFLLCTAKLPAAQLSDMVQVRLAANR